MIANVFHRRLGRLFYCLISVLVALAIPMHAADPQKTIVSDVVYRADGTAAKGTILISWPAFSTADGKPVAAGSMSVKIGANGAVNIALIPTQGATPSGTAYKIVIALDDGSSSTEYWAVPTLSPTTIAAIRATQVPATVAMQVVSRDYVDAQLATAVRKNGDETISGEKTFEDSPLVPPPGTETAAANKAYVDDAIAAAVPSAANVLNVNKGGTGTNAFTASRCVRVADDGNSLESAAADCGGGGSGGNADTLDGLHASELTNATRLQGSDVATPSAAGTLMRFNGSSIDWTNTPSLRALNGLRFADQFSGADIGEKLNAATADYGAAPACGGTIAARGSYPYGTTISFGNRLGCSVHGAGAGRQGTGGSLLQWAGATAGTMWSVLGNVAGGSFSGFQLHGNGSAMIGLDLAGAAAQTTDRNRFSDFSVWNVTGTDDAGGLAKSVGVRVGSTAVGNPDLNGNEISNFAISYGAGRMKALLEQNGTQTVMNHVHDASLTYTGAALAPDFYMHFNGGDVIVDHVVGTGPANASSGVGNYVVEPAALMANFDKIEHEVGGGTAAPPVFSFPAGNRVWPTSLRNVRIKWERSDAANKIIDFQQHGTLSIEDSEIHSDDEGTPGHGTITFNNPNGGYPAFLRWRNTWMFPNNCLNFAIALGSNIRVDADPTACLFATSGSNPHVLYSDVGGYANRLMYEPTPRDCWRTLGAAADGGTWCLRTDSSNLYLSLANDARNSYVNAITIARNGMALNSVTMPTVITSAILSGTTDRAGTGWMRLAKSDNIAFRNNANTGDVNGVSLDASDVVQVGGNAGAKLAGPLQTNNSSLVTNLNADQLDGKHAADLVVSADKTGAGAKVPSIDASPADGCAQLASGKIVSTGSACGSGGSATALAAGTAVSLTAPRQYYICTSTCTVTPPVPAAGYEFCVMNDNNVSTVITLAALGSSSMYENTARTAYGTAGTGTLVSSGAAGDKVCIVGRDSTHYLTTTYTGTWTAN